MQVRKGASLHTCATRLAVLYGLRLTFEQAQQALIDRLIRLPVGVGKD